jgi:thioredoxin 1
MTIKLTDQNFDETISEGITLVDFWAEWCGPCVLIAPVLEEISNEINGVKIAKLDVDSNPVSSAKYGIRSIPTMIVFKDGEVIDKIMGGVPKQVIINKLNNHL